MKDGKGNQEMSAEQKAPIAEIKIKRSPKRKRTVSASLKNGVLEIMAPATLSDRELQPFITQFKERFLRRQLKKELDAQHDLMSIAQRLNKTYFGEKLKITGIEYSSNQNSRFGCCNLRTGKILISNRLGRMPDWVRDYVIMHELAHLVYPNHGRNFQDLTARYRLKERAIGYLMAKGYEEREKDLET
ncbi:MAG TPA: M48 family metallopeptidase [Thermodesulfobacteriota bacterium]|nr:M48 family metallopeptidase [Thermodesulfobacteriota bacterium]